MYTLGIDLGKNGGFCLLNDKRVIQHKMSMPTHPVDGNIDHFEVESFLARCKGTVKENDIVLAMEKVGGRSGNAASAMYSFGKNNGYIEALVHHWFQRDIKEITPRSWQKWLFEIGNIEEVQNAKGKRDTKRMAKEAISKFYPNEDFRATKRSKLPHDGIIDSVGIALYAMEKLNKPQEER